MHKALLLTWLSSCAPSIVDQPWLIDAPRVIAVTMEPPEAAPGMRVRLRAVVSESPAELRWSKCDEPRAFSQNASVNPDCITELAASPTSSIEHEVVLASDVCSTFGPAAPSAGIRPRDPDATGGTYQPVGVQLEDAATFAFVRLWCQPAGISFDVARAYAAEAKPNVNPDFVLSVEGELAAGNELQLRADWSGSPEESYALIDPTTAALTSAVELYDVAWFVTAGEIVQARSSSGLGRWRLPSEPGTATLWAVLRDSRGGVAVKSVTVAIPSPP